MMRYLANAQNVTALAGRNTLLVGGGGCWSAATGLEIVHWVGCINTIKGNFGIKTRDVTPPNISCLLIAKYYSCRHRITAELIKLPQILSFIL